MLWIGIAIVIGFFVVVYSVGAIIGWLTGWWERDDAAEFACRTTEVVSDIVSDAWR